MTRGKVDERDVSAPHGVYGGSAMMQGDESVEGSADADVNTHAWRQPSWQHLAELVSCVEALEFGLSAMDKRINTSAVSSLPRITVWTDSSVHKAAGGRLRLPRHCRFLPDL